MIIPWGSDAPLYHRPFATVALIVLCTVFFCAFPWQEHEEWALVLGDGIHPLQWLTSLFLHVGPGHLVGNMIFLWAFGIIVEGKLGWFAFTLAYLGIGVCENAGLQLLVSSTEPVRLVGASGAIFGLLAMCLVWAPRNELQCIWLFRILPMELDVPIMWLALFYIGVELVTVGFMGLAISSALAHCCGALLGFALAVALLALDWVDCENWDLFAVLQGRQGRLEQPARRGTFKPRRDISELLGPAKKPAKSKRNAKGAVPPVTSIVDPSTAALRNLRLHLEMGEVDAALAVYTQESPRRPDWQLSETDWRELIEALLKQDAYIDAVSVMRDYLERMPDPSPRVRLKLAQVLVEKLARPLQALKVLGEIPQGSLQGELEAVRRRLVRQAEQMHQDEDGPLELQDELW